MSDAAASAAAAIAAQNSVSVQFFTKADYPKQQMPNTTFTVPIGTLPEGLSTLVNEVLSLSPPVPLDFLINDQYISNTLERFMRRRGLTPEDVLQIEYQPALQAQEGSKLPHDDWVSSVRAPLSGVSSCIVTGAYDHCVRVWAGDDCLAIGGGHREAVKEIALRSASGPAAATTSGEDRTRGSSKRRARDQTVVVPETIEFASCGKDGSIRTWRFDSASRKISPLGCASQHVDAIDTVDIDPSPEHRLVASGSWDCAVKVFNWDDLVNAREDDSRRAVGVAVAGLATSGACAPLVTFTDHARAVLKVRFSPGFGNGNHVLYSTGLDGCVKVWNVETSQLTATLSASHASHALAVRPGNSGGSDMIVTGNTDGRLRLFDARTKTGAVQTWSGHRQWVYGAAWLWRADEAGASSISQHLLASAAEDSTVRLWDMRATSGTALLTLDKLHSDGVLDVTYAGGNEIVSCGKDNRAKSSKIECPK
mgnify:FL=1